MHLSYQISPARKNCHAWKHCRTRVDLLWPPVQVTLIACRTGLRFTVRLEYPPCARIGSDVARCGGLNSGGLNHYAYANHTWCTFWQRHAAGICRWCFSGRSGRVGPSFGPASIAGDAKLANNIPAFSTQKADGSPRQRHSATCCEILVYDLYSH